MENYKLTIDNITYTFLTKDSLYWFVWQFIKSLASKNIRSYTIDDLKKLYKESCGEEFIF